MGRTMWVKCETGGSESHKQQAATRPFPPVSILPKTNSQRDQMATQPHKYTAATSNTHTIWYKLKHKYTWTSHGCVICSSNASATVMIKSGGTACKHNKARICLGSNWPPHQSVRVGTDAGFISLLLCPTSNCNYMSYRDTCVNVGHACADQMIYVEILMIYEEMKDRQ